MGQCQVFVEFLRGPISRNGSGSLNHSSWKLNPAGREINVTEKNKSFCSAIQNKKTFKQS